MIIAGTELVLTLGDGTVTYVAAAVQTSAGQMTSGDALLNLLLLMEQQIH